MNKIAATFLGTNISISEPSIDKDTNMVSYVVTCSPDVTTTVSDPAREIELKATMKKMELELFLHAHDAYNMSRREFICLLVVEKRMLPVRASDIYMEFKTNGGTLFPKLRK